MTDQKCECPAKLRTCPYEEEMHDNYMPYCECCDACQAKCVKLIERESMRRASRDDDDDFDF